jgi:uncharacterized protein GlcG (DUF336 family)
MLNSDREVAVIGGGAVGVPGASGGDKDEACAKDGLAAVQDRLEF